LSQFKARLSSVLGWSRLLASGKLELTVRPTLMQPLVESGVRSQRAAAAAKHITLGTDLDPVLGPIAADPDRLQQIVWNLVSNAIKFTPSEGHVDVRLSADDGAPVLRGVTSSWSTMTQTRDFVRTTLELYGGFVVTASTAQEARAVAASRRGVSTAVMGPALTAVAPRLRVYLA
jgi:signal transduction histidine kinase